MGSSMALALLWCLQPPPNVAEGPPSASFSADPLASQSMLSDARLADVCFVDLHHGWAVGDRGAIWHTDDGGGNWRLQRSGVTCPLKSVFFLNPQIGWAAGGFAHPYAYGSTGVLLATTDGGRHWHHNPRLLLPALKRVGFFDPNHGWAIGDCSAMFPSGVFVTDSGGRGWNPVSGGGSACWTAADLLDPYTGILAGRRGSVARVQRGAVQPSQTAGFGLRNLARAGLVAAEDDRVRGWLVGTDGLILTSEDLGASWQTPAGEPPQAMANHFDFRALAARGTNCWIAGSPGTRVFHSPDNGTTWTAWATGSQVPLHGLCFVDPGHGWAVGSLGTILATADGGRTWRPQRSGGSRAALLGLFSDGRDVPLELFARLSGNEGYLAAVEVLGRRDVELQSPRRTHRADRLHQAVVAVGASDAHTASRFPLRQAGLGLPAEKILDGWDRANDGRGLAELQAYVVRQIRLWRPEVIVTHDASPRGEEPLKHLINQVVLRAVEQAADPTALPEQVTLAGLQPWGVKKVYAALPPGRRGRTEVTTAMVATRLGRSLAEVSAGPRGLLQDRFSVAPQTLGFRLMVRRLPQQQGVRDFFSGIVLQPGGEARRRLMDPPPESLDLLRRTAQRQRNVQALIKLAENGPQGTQQLLAQTADLTRGLDPEGAGRVLYQLAERYRRTGRWPLAAETLTLLCERYPGHPLVRPALAWLVQYYAAGEARWRIHRSQRGYAVRQASTLSIDGAEQEDRLERAAALGRQIERTLPELYAEPGLRFALAAADRGRGFPRQAERFYLMQARSATDDPWRASARGEQWLARPQGPAPKPVLPCAAAVSKPRLDGRLDDDVWRGAKPAELHSVHHDDAGWPGVVMLAHDAEFLYLAINCRRSPEGKYETATGPRPRDPDLSRQDRVDLLLDVDRDYATYYRLTVDHRGWVGEGCWGDATWDPTWFVAAQTSQGAWTAEAAIPLDQLTGRTVAAGDVWAVGVQRTVPGVGLQSWSTPAAVGIRPEGFGYLVFE